MHVLTRPQLRQRLRWLEYRKRRALDEARDAGLRGNHDEERRQAETALRLGAMVTRVTRELDS